MTHCGTGPRHPPRSPLGGMAALTPRNARLIGLWIRAPAVASQRSGESLAAPKRGRGGRKLGTSQPLAPVVRGRTRTATVQTSCFRVAPDAMSLHRSGSARWGTCRFEGTTCYPLPKGARSPSLSVPALPIEVFRMSAGTESGIDGAQWRHWIVRTGALALRPSLRGIAVMSEGTA
jgi:hypothetical protein